MRDQDQQGEETLPSSAFIAACFAIGVAFGLVFALTTTPPPVIDEEPVTHMQGWSQNTITFGKIRRGASKACGGDGTGFGANSNSYNCF